MIAPTSLQLPRKVVWYTDSILFSVLRIRRVMTSYEKTLPIALNFCRGQICACFARSRIYFAKEKFNCLCERRSRTFCPPTHPSRALCGEGIQFELSLKYTATTIFYREARVPQNFQRTYEKYRLKPHFGTGKFFMKKCKNKVIA